MLSNDMTRKIQIIKLISLHTADGKDFLCSLVQASQNKSKIKLLQDQPP